MKMILDRLPPGLRVGTSVLVSAVAVGVSAVVVAVSLGSVASTLTLPSIDESESDPVSALATKSAEEIERSRKRFDNRSMYTLPAAPPRRTPVVKREDPKPPPIVDPGPPPVPKTYAGPQPTSVVGEFVVFGSLPEEDKRIKVGQTKAGVKVVAIDAPYFVKLAYQGGEFDVALLPKSDPAVLSREGNSFRRANLGGSGSSGSLSTGSNTPPRSDGAAGTTTTKSGTAGAGSNGSANANAATNMNKNAPTNADPVNATQSGGFTGAGSSAMQPQRFPPPGQPPADSGSDAGTEFVDRELLPRPLFESEINAFSMDQARAALEAINSTEKWNVDDHSRARLNHEKALLKARLARG